MRARLGGRLGAGLGLMLGFLLWASTVPAAAEPFVFDKGFTLLTFSWSHLGLSRQQARFNGIDGIFDIDPERPEASRVDVTIRASSVQSGVDAFDRILRSPDYFDVQAHPTISFRSTGITRTGEKTADVAGDLTMLDVTKPATLQVTLNTYGPHPSAAASPAYVGRKVASFSARAQVLRSSWGMTRATPLVSDEIEIVIETELLSKE